MIMYTRPVRHRGKECADDSMSSEKNGLAGSLSCAGLGFRERFESRMRNGRTGQYRAGMLVFDSSLTDSRNLPT